MTSTQLAIAFAVALVVLAVCVWLGCLVSAGDAHRDNEARRHHSS